jgi:hypothetical protein
VSALTAELNFGLDQLLPLEVNLTDSLDVKLAIEKSIAHLAKSMSLSIMRVMVN